MVAWDEQSPWLICHVYAPLDPLPISSYDAVWWALHANRMHVKPTYRIFIKCLWKAQTWHLRTHYTNTRGIRLELCERWMC